MVFIIGGIGILVILITFFSILKVRANVRRRKSFKPTPHLVSTPISQPAAIPLNKADTTSAPLPETSSPDVSAVPDALKQLKLLIPDSESEKISTEILKITKNMPRPHPILSALMRETESTEELFNLIKTDPEIAAKILQTVNSAAFYLAQKITRLNYAIMYLGTTLVRDIALQVAIQGKSNISDPVQKKAMEKVWAASFVSSSIAFIMAQSLSLNASELSTQALLFSIGNLAMISFHPQYAQLYAEDLTLYDRVNLEQQELKTNSAIVGEKLATEWELPTEIKQGIKYSLIPLAVPVQECQLDKETLQGVVFCYGICRIGEVIALNGIKDIAEIDLQKISLDFFYFHDYLKAAGLERFLQIFQDAAFRRNANQILKRVVS